MADQFIHSRETCAFRFVLRASFWCVMCKVSGGDCHGPHQVVPNRRPTRRYHGHGTFREKTFGGHRHHVRTSTACHWLCNQGLDNLKWIL